ncbi:MAG: hypothetical protein K2Z81_11850, partial [Cyanobacteria bacterium]|nr:hypothetical protein [Cyanobacteriota bacterium]
MYEFWPESAKEATSQPLHNPVGPLCNNDELAILKSLIRLNSDQGWQSLPVCDLFCSAQQADDVPGSVDGSRDRRQIEEDSIRFIKA